MLFHRIKYFPTFGTSYKSLLTAMVAGYIMTTVICATYLLSKNIETLVR